MTFEVRISIICGGTRTVIKESDQEAFLIAAEFAGVSPKTIRNRYYNSEYRRGEDIVVGGNGRVLIREIVS